MNDNFKEKSSTFFTRKSSLFPDSDNDKSDNADFEEKYNVELQTSAAMIVSHFETFDNKKFGGIRKFPTKSGSSMSKRSDTGNSKKYEGKFSNCGGADHFDQG